MNKKRFLTSKYFFLPLFFLSLFCFSQTTLATSLPTASNKKIVSTTVVKKMVKKVVAKKIIKPKVSPALIGGYEVSTAEGEDCAVKNSDKVFPIASLTKMMTALIFIENQQSNWDEQITYDPAKHFVYGNFLKFRKGDQISVKDLLNSMLVGSINEAAKMLIVATGLTQVEFVSLMNQKAEELGMLNTHYVDSSGISPRNISSANDQTKLLKTIFNNSTLREVMDATEYKLTITPKKGKVVNKLVHHTNSLLGSKNFEILASKTGYLDEARNCLAMVIQKNGHVYYVVTLNDPSRYRDFSNTWSLIEKYAN